MARSSRRRRAANVAAGMLRGDFRSGISTLACSVFPCDTSGQSYHLSDLCQHAGISWRVKAGPPASRVPGFSRVIIPSPRRRASQVTNGGWLSPPPSLSYLSRLSSAVNKAGLTTGGDPVFEPGVIRPPFECCRVGDGSSMWNRMTGRRARAGSLGLGHHDRFAVPVLSLPLPGLSGQLLVDGWVRSISPVSSLGR